MNRWSVLVAVIVGVVAMGLAGPGWVAVHGQSEDPVLKPTDLTKMVFFSVLEGLFEDAVPDEAVAIVLRQEELGEDKGKRYMHFVYACPLCTPALNAFIIYGKRANFTWKGSRFISPKSMPEEVMTRLRSEDIEERLEALDGLIEKWVARRLDSMRLSPEENAAWQRQLAQGRKKGMYYLQLWKGEGRAGSFTAMKGCAVCDGANAASE